MVCARIKQCYYQNTQNNNDRYPCGDLFCDVARIEEKEIDKWSCFTYASTGSNLEIAYDISAIVDIEKCSLKFFQPCISGRFISTFSSLSFMELAHLFNFEIK